MDVSVKGDTGGKQHETLTGERPIKTISNAHYLWWSALEPLIGPQVWVQMGLQNNRILLKYQQQI